MPPHPGLSPHAHALASHALVSSAPKADHSTLDHNHRFVVPLQDKSPVSLATSEHPSAKPPLSIDYSRLLFPISDILRRSARPAPRASTKPAVVNTTVTTTGAKTSFSGDRKVPLSGMLIVVVVVAVVDDRESPEAFKAVTYERSRLTLTI